MSLSQFREGVWTDTTEVVHLRLRLPATMCVLRLHGGALLVHSPIALTEERRRSVMALGEVAHLHAPNLYHNTWIREWAAAFPGACVHAPRGLGEKLPDLRIGRTHGEQPVSSLDPDVEELAIEGFWLRESVLFHRPSGTLVVADLVHNMAIPRHAWTRLYAALMGFSGRVAISRMLRWTAFRDPRAARRSLDRVLDLPIRSVVVGHGRPIESQARDELRSAYRWLPAAGP